MAASGNLVRRVGLLIALSQIGFALGPMSAMSMVSTRILTDDNQALVVPNGKIWGDVIKNFSAEKTRRVDLSFRVHYGEDLERIEKLLGDIVNSQPKVLKDPAAIVRLNAMADASLEFVVWEAYRGITRAVKLRFDQESIRAALPQHELYQKDSNPRPR